MAEYAFAFAMSYTLILSPYMFASESKWLVILGAVILWLFTIYLFVIERSAKKPSDPDSSEE